MKVIFGLGNPGEKYLLTRHNVGFLFLDYLAQKFGSDKWQEKSKFKGAVCEISINNQKVLLVKPLTFMNLSGDTVQAVKSFYNLELMDLVVVYDDIDLNFADIRYRDKGSAGTHNGMRSVILQMGTDEVPRLRIGVENRDEELKAKWALADYVLAKFTEDERMELVKIFAEAYEMLLAKEIL